MATDLSTPQSRSEMYLATLSGDYSGDLPTPQSRAEEYLQKIVQEGLGPDLSQADIEQAVTNYLDENGVTLSFDVDANGNLVLKG